MAKRATFCGLRWRDDCAFSGAAPRWIKACPCNSLSFQQVQNTRRAICTYRICIYETLAVWLSMTNRISTHLTRALFCGALLQALLLASLPAAAAGCQKDSGGGCQNETRACSPPDGGKCYTTKERRVLNCRCMLPTGTDQERQQHNNPNPEQQGSQPMNEQPN